MDQQKGLIRSLGLGYVIVVVVGNIVGSGVFKKIAPMAAELHSAGWIMAAWAAAGLITLFGALSNAEVAGMLADTGGDFAYYKKIYNRFFSFLYGWSLFAVIQTAAIASLAYVFAESLNSMISLPDMLVSMGDLSVGGIFFPFADFKVKLTAILLIGILTYVNLIGLKEGAGVSKAVLIMVFTGIFAIVVFGLGSDNATFDGVLSFKTIPGQEPTASSFFTAMLAAFWAYQGWVTVGFIGGEVKDPNRNIPKGIISGVFMVIVLYLIVNITYLALLNIPQLEAIYNSGKQIAAIEAVRSFWGSNGVLFISALILVSTLGCTNATILASARTYFAMSRDGMFFRSAGKLNQAHVPSHALLLQGIWASGLVLSGTFDQLTDMVVFSVYIFYGATALGVFILRRKMPNAYRPYKAWGYPVIPAIFILFCVALFFNTVITRPREAAIGMSLILAGVPLYFILRKRREQ